MTGLVTATERRELVIEIGGLPIRVCVDDADFSRLLQHRYDGFVSSSPQARFEFEIDLAPPGLISEDDEVHVLRRSGRWSLDRGDFHAEWDASSAHGRIRQTANPYSIDAVLRIVHTLLLAKEGGFLIHASSAVRGGRAFLFSGVSGVERAICAVFEVEFDTALLDAESLAEDLARHGILLFSDKPLPSSTSGAVQK